MLKQSWITNATVNSENIVRSLESRVWDEMVLGGLLSVPD